MPKIEIEISDYALECTVELRRIKEAGILPIGSVSLICEGAILDAYNQALQRLIDEDDNDQTPVLV